MVVQERILFDVHDGSWILANDFCTQETMPSQVDQLLKSKLVVRFKLADNSAGHDRLDLLLVCLLLRGQLHNVLNAIQKFEVNVSAEHEIHKVSMLSKRVNNVARLVGYLFCVFCIGYYLGQEPVPTDDCLSQAVLVTYLLLVFKVRQSNLEMHPVKQNRLDLPLGYHVSCPKRLGLKRIFAENRGTRSFDHLVPVDHNIHHAFSNNHKEICGVVILHNLGSRLVHFRFHFDKDCKQFIVADLLEKGKLLHVLLKEVDLKVVPKLHGFRANVECVELLRVEVFEVFHYFVL